MAIIRMHFRVPDGVKCIRAGFGTNATQSCPFRLTTKCNMFNKSLVVDADGVPFKCQDCIEHEIPELQPPEPVSNN